MARAFIIRPFGIKTDSSGKKLDFDAVEKNLILPALKSTKLTGSTTAEIIDSGNIREDMFSMILEADLVICDITIHNANVFYELGIRHSLRKKRTILLRGRPTADKDPFDLKTDRYLNYNVENPKENKNELVNVIESTLTSNRETDSPVFRLLPGLQEADLDKIKVVPFDFLEEVERAHASRSKGWLRLLSKELMGKRFQNTALPIVADAQMNLKDFEGARDTWEVVRNMYPDNVKANLALSNVYERLYKVHLKSDLLELSEQAINRVIKNKEALPEDKVEARALQGRNLQTRWNLAFKGVEDLKERRYLAMNRSLYEAFEVYYSAFYKDLNHFYSGLVALQLASIFLDIADDDDHWLDVFDSDEEAIIKKKRLEKIKKEMEVIVEASIDVSLKNTPKHDSNRVWSLVSKADLLFLKESPKRVKRVISAYKRAIPVDRLFVWDSARGQLALFESLGVRSKLARQIIDKIDIKYDPPEDPQKSHLVLFAGHRVNTSKAKKVRFPVKKEAKAKKMIKDALLALKEKGVKLHGMASAAPGSDILFHEVCRELKIKTDLCLPIPVEDFSRIVFAELDDWRARFIDIKSEEDKNVLELSNRDGLPYWLNGKDEDYWKRGNEWLAEMAQCAGAHKLTFLALWDGEEKASGTAHMIEIIRNAGEVKLELIDATKL